MYKWAYVALLAAAPLQALAIDDPYHVNGAITPGTLHSGMSSFSAQQSGAIPTIVVESKGNDMVYDHVPDGQTFSSSFSYNVDCRGLYNVRYLFGGVSDQTLNLNAYKNEGKFVYTDWEITPNSDKKNKRSGTMTLSGPLTTKLKNNAIAVCNRELNKSPEAIHQGFNVNWAQIGHDLVPYRNYAYARCSMDEQRGSFLTQGLKVNYVCKARPKPVPVAQVALMSVNSVTLVAQTPNYKGPCPKTVSFNGTIHTNGTQGAVKYRFRNHWGVVTEFKTLQFAKDEKSKSVSYDLTLSDIEQFQGGLPGNVQGPGNANLPQVKPQLGIKENPFVELEVQSQTGTKTAKASYRYQCVAPAVPSAGFVAPETQTKSDLTAGEIFHLGTKSAPWGASLVVGSADASGKGPRGCQFRFRYDLKNIGGGAAGLHHNVLRGNGVQLHQDATQQLPSGQSKPVAGQLTLKPGKHLIALKVDANGQVEEENEGNNDFRIEVTVSESCADGTPARPVREAPRPQLPQ